MADYTNLEGNEVDVYYRGNGKLNRMVGIIVGIDPDIGITVVGKLNPNDYILCLMSPDVFRSTQKKDPSSHDEMHYMNIFNLNVQALKKGFLDMYQLEIAERDNFSFESGQNPSIEGCAFAQ
jgi:hypothetical protein